MNKTLRLPEETIMGVITLKVGNLDVMRAYLY